MMRKFDFKTDITWRDVAKRVLLVVSAVALIVWFMPRDNKPNFKMEANKVWLYSDLTANIGNTVWIDNTMVGGTDVKFLAGDEKDIDTSMKGIKQNLDILAERGVITRAQIAVDLKGAKDQIS